MSPTARSLAYLRGAGSLAQVVEKWVPRAKRRIDLLGFIDVIEVAASGIAGVQVTTSGNLAARLTKIRTECADNARRWLQAGGTIVLHGWAKKGARGKRKVWQLTERAVTLADLEG